MGHWNPGNSPVEVGSWNPRIFIVFIMYRVFFTIPGGCLGFLPSTIYALVFLWFQKLSSLSLVVFFEMNLVVLGLKVRSSFWLLLNRMFWFAGIPDVQRSQTFNIQWVWGVEFGIGTFRWWTLCQDMSRLQLQHYSHNFTYSIMLVKKNIYIRATQHVPSLLDASLYVWATQGGVWHDILWYRPGFQRCGYRRGANWRWS